MKTIFTTLVFFILTILQLTGQSEPEFEICRTPPFLPPSPGFIQQATQSFVTNSDSMLYIPVTVHIVGDDNGNGYYSMDETLNAMCQLNEDFEPYGFHFYIEGAFNYINDSDFYSMTQEFSGGDGENQFLEAHNTPNTLNIYFNEYIPGAGGYLTGDCLLFDNSAFPPTIYNAQRQAIVVRKSTTNNNSHLLTHEVGHYFILWHTFVGWEGTNYNDYIGAPAPDSLTLSWACLGDSIHLGRTVEKVDGSNCEFAADYFCDTPPDYLSIGFLCNGNGESDLVQLDPDSVAFRSDGSFYMSYSNNNCQNRFSDGQVEWMRAVAQHDNARGYLLYDQSPPPQISVDDLMLIDPPNNETVAIFDSVTLEWDMPEADFFELDFGRKFNGVHLSFITNVYLEESNLKVHVFAEQEYYWVIRGVSGYYPCEIWRDTSYFFTEEAVSVKNIDAGPTLRLFPNPATNKLYLQFSKPVLDQSLEISLYDVQGNFVNDQQIAAGAAINIEDLPKGMYLLKAVIADQIYTGKFVKQ